MALRQELVLITPELAQMFYENLAVNRKLRPAAVDVFCTEIIQGTFRTTHQGIAINTQGQVIDGQHRLAAIIKTQIPVTMFVAWDCEAVKAMDWPCDNGQPRSTAQILDYTPVEGAIVEAVLALHRGTRKRFSTTERLTTFNFFKSSMDSLKSQCPAIRKSRTATPIRVPVLLRAMLDGAQIGCQYRAFVLLEYKDMWPSIQALTRQLADVAISQKEAPLHMIARVWQAFNPARKHVTRIQLSDPDGQILEIRQALFDLGYPKALELAGC